MMICLILVFLYMIAEAVGGWMANSLALLADAGHMLSDVAALGLSLFAMWFAGRPANARRTYGYHRAEILAALVNGAALVAISILILIEAIERFRSPPEVHGSILMGIAIGGLVVNLVSLWLLHAGRGESLNVHGAWLHVLTDALGSVGAIAAGVLVWAWKWNWADPAISILIGALVVYSSWNLLKESVAVLMESAPKGVNVDRVREVMMGVSGVVAVHDLHVWSITSGMDALSAHVVAEEGAGYPELLVRIRGALHDGFGIDHQTIQIEPGGFVEHRGTI
ncbi:MAG: cation transporter [Phycisphaerales bacterium]|nr:cation transporter [Phycisphaerales bacterium]